MQSYNKSTVLPAMFRTRDAMGRERWVEEQPSIPSSPAVTLSDSHGTTPDEGGVYDDDGTGQYYIDGIE